MWLLLSSLIRFARFFRQPGKSAREVFQLVLAGAILGIMVMYIALLAVTVLATVEQQLFSAGEPDPALLVSEAEETGAARRPDTDAATLPDRFAAILERVAAALTVQNLQSLIVVLTGLGFFYRGNIKQLIADIAIEYSSVIDYISHGTGRDEIEVTPSRISRAHSSP